MTQRGKINVSQGRYNGFKGVSVKTPDCELFVYGAKPSDIQIVYEKHIGDKTFLRRFRAMLAVDLDDIPGNVSPGEFIELAAEKAAYLMENGSQ